MSPARRLVLALALGSAPALAGGCVSVGTATRAGEPAYTINVQRPNQVSTGPAIRSLFAGSPSRGAEVRAVLDARPGLRRALLENGVDVRRIIGLRIDPDNVVDVFVSGRE